MQSIAIVGMIKDDFLGFVNISKPLLRNIVDWIQLEERQVRLFDAILMMKAKLGQQSITGQTF